MPHRTLLVTVGSTLFPALTDSVLSPSFISLLSSHGIDRLIIQYGRADLPFNTTTKDMAMNPAGHGSTVWKPDGSSSGVAVEVMRFTDDFEGLVASADAIISHAGSGSILTVLRSKPVKRLLIVPNTSLMDNHQVELAEALEARNHLLVSTVEDLETRLPLLLSDSTKLDPFPDVQPGRFAGILDATMGYAS